MTPSVVGLDAQGRILVGRAARAARHRTVTRIRSRVLGSHGRNVEAAAARQRALELEAMPGAVHPAATNGPIYGWISAPGP